MVKESDSYINHATIHHIRIPAGKLALAWLGSHAKILEDTGRPYKINHPLFRLEKKDKGYFLNATEQMITHGSIKRIIPHTGQVTPPSPPTATGFGFLAFLEKPFFGICVFWLFPCMT